LSGNDLVVGVEIETELDALEGERRQRLLLRGLLLSSAYLTSALLNKNSKKSSLAVTFGGSG
jgi:hypothetical protein